MRLLGVDLRLGRNVDKQNDMAEKRLIDSQFGYNTRPTLDMINTLGDSEVKIPMYPLPMSKLYDVVKFSDCLSTITKALKKEIFRNGYEVTEKFASKCFKCGKEFEHEEDKCDECGSMLLKTPDPKQKRKAEEFLKDMNENEQDVLEVSETIENDENTVDDGYMLARKEYCIDFNKQIIGSKLLEILRVHPQYIRIVADDTGRPGRDKDGQIIKTCVFHRGKIWRGAETCPECGAPLYTAYFQGKGPDDKDIYYIKGEIMHKSKHNPSLTYGFSPVFAVWMKATTLMNQDYYMLKYYAAQRPPRGLLFVRTPNIASLEKAWNWMLDMFKRNPHMIPPMAIEGEGITGKFTEFIDFMRSLDEMQFTAVREEFRRTIGAIYGVMPIFQADISVSGGLNNEGLQVTVTNRAVEEGQKTYNDDFYPWIMEHLGITDYVLKLLPSEEKDEMAELQVEAMKIQNARAMQAMGYEVTLNEDKEFEYEPTEVPVQAPGMGMQTDAFGNLQQQPGGERAVPTNPSRGLGAQQAPMGGARQTFTGTPRNPSVGANVTMALKKKSGSSKEETESYLKKTRVYLKPGAEGPSGVSVQTGPQGGRYYDTTVPVKPQEQPRMVKPEKLIQNFKSMVDFKNTKKEHAIAIIDGKAKEITGNAKRVSMTTSVEEFIFDDIRTVHNHPLERPPSNGDIFAFLYSGRHKRDSVVLPSGDVYTFQRTPDTDKLSTISKITEDKKDDQPTILRANSDKRSSITSFNKTYNRIMASEINSKGFKTREEALSHSSELMKETLIRIASIYSFDILLNGEKINKTGKADTPDKNPNEGIASEISSLGDEETIEDTPMTTAKADAPVTSNTAGVHNPAYDRIRRRRKRAIVAFNMKVLRDVIKETKTPYDVTKAEPETLADFIHDATYGKKFQGVSMSISERIKEYMIRGITRGYGLKRMMNYINRTGGRSVSMGQAESIARTESQALQNKAREWSFQKVDPQEKWKYKWLNPNDHRTTEICKNIVARSRGGVSLKALRRMVEDESKAAGFEPREWTPHINCRSSFVRVM